MPNVTMTLEEFEALRRLVTSERESEGSSLAMRETKKTPRKPSAYNLRYAKHFDKVSKRYKKKSGGWMKDGFKRTQKEAHRLARGEK